MSGNQVCQAAVQRSPAGKWACVMLVVVCIVAAVGLSDVAPALLSWGDPTSWQQERELQIDNERSGTIEEIAIVGMLF